MYILYYNNYICIFIAKKILGLDVEEESLLDEAQTDEISESKTTPVRQSRRIAQIKIKEEAERRKLEEFTLYQLKEDQKKRNDKDVKVYIYIDIYFILIRYTIYLKRKFK